ncbi:MAG: lipase family protein [Actinobacteria bacterium]|nr:lipase family protein [Actinomycetota bacterium]
MGSANTARRRGFRSHYRGSTRDRGRNPHLLQLPDSRLVITDYEGGGTPIPQSYLVGPPEGYAGLDAARAAQRLDPRDDLTQDSPVGLSGYSQGGQAASWAAELQPRYAPELNVKGVLAGGIPYDMNA